MLARPSTFFSLRLSFFSPLPPPFFLLALLSYFSRLSWFVFDRSRRYRLLFFFFLPFLVKWVSPRLREFYKKRGEARGARRETLFFFFISMAIEYLATDTDHDRSRKKLLSHAEERIARGANIVGVFEPAFTGLTARPRWLHGLFRPHRRATGPVSE